MIVKDEAHNLPSSLGRAAALFDQAVVADTGSRDGSQGLARAMGAKVVEIPWANDFAAARNLALAQCSCRYVLWLDADNFIGPEAVGAVRHALRSLEGQSPEALPHIFLLTEKVVPQGERLWQKRVFPNLPECRFQGRVHEQLSHPPEWPVVEIKAEIEHWGYSSLDLSRAKGLRNLELLLSAPETQGGDFYYLYQTGRTCHNLRRYAQAEGWLLRASEAKADNFSLWAHSLILLSEAQSRLGRPQEARLSLARLRKADPSYGPGRFFLGKLLYRSEDYGLASLELEAALRHNLSDPYWGAQAGPMAYTAASLLARIELRANRLGEAREACLTALSYRPEDPEALSALAEIYLAENMEAPARDCLERALAASPEHRKSRRLLSGLAKGGGAAHNAGLAGMAGLTDLEKAEARNGPPTDKGAFEPGL
jgi:tetratricopeptide (TPR) repeat protein